MSIYFWDLWLESDAFYRVSLVLCARATGTWIILLSCRVVEGARLEGGGGKFLRFSFQSPMAGGVLIMGQGWIKIEVILWQEHLKNLMKRKTVIGEDLGTRNRLRGTLWRGSACTCQQALPGYLHHAWSYSIGRFGTGWVGCKEVGKIWCVACQHKCSSISAVWGGWKRNLDRS